MSTLRNKWSFYTRTTNQSPLIKDKQQSIQTEKSQENIFTLNSPQSEKCETVNERDSINY
ncbi:hypothetical protein TTHERM_00075930 (macronuclear) [Tetrahymena thermophila SB210]|uniref:Uncharacterized protein n=1 Tax=Tetrahymena thermophila (strain SB210) TaxID=312017 RepID=Q23G72_TETTS|nr:hypothetical protein TTHERM_00075930 [Tetrahymena thermophila SB210]EAR95388.2 hypothetical protein TTHERM_00075930 [Tetrahymena thermophila SB210]|eukprot:XP_001015633.2 hypothetical protein TTHERM_00075930 [Tetrahymena thermophila SB210]